MLCIVPDWWNPLWRALHDAAIGDEQSLRDYYMACAYLASDGAYAEGLTTMLSMQWRTDSAVYSTCLNQRFFDTDAKRLRVTISYALNLEDQNPYGLAIPGKRTQIVSGRLPA